MKRLLLALLLIPVPAAAQTGQLISPPFVGTWRGPVDTVLDLPECTEASVNDVRVVEDAGALYVCTDEGWALASGGGADLPVCEEGELLVANALGFLVCSGLPDHEHTLSDVTDAGTAAARDVPAVGDATATEVVLGSDSRLTDAREPTAHAASHGEGGSDEVTLAAGQVTGLDDSHAHTSATASLSVGESGEAHAEAGTLTFEGCTVSITAGVATITCEGGGGVEVPGSGSELLHRVDGETLGAVAGSSVADGVIKTTTGLVPTLGEDSQVVIGSGASVHPTANTTTVVIGFNASSNQTSSVAVGPGASASGTRSVAIGQGASAGQDAVSVGRGASGAGTAIGTGASAVNHGICIGRGCSSTAAGEIVLGSSVVPITTLCIGERSCFRSNPPEAVTIRATGGGGTDNAGSHTVLAGGPSTGTALGGSVVFQTSPSGSSGNTPNALTDQWTIRGSDGVLIRAALDDAPASQDAACTLGEIRYTATHKYFCIADGNWGRIAWDTDW